MTENNNEFIKDKTRAHVFASTYANISIDNYYSAQKLYQSIVEAEYNELVLPPNTYSSFCEHVIITIIFSAMSIESFVNDYGASCLGDDLFYKDFDRLSVLSKLQLISTFLFKEPLDKKQSYYSHTKELFSYRDSLVHSKSRSMDWYLEKKGIELFKKEPEEKEFLIEKILIDQEEVKKDYHALENAIKALRDIACFFEKHDKNSSALWQFFNLSGFSSRDQTAANYVVKKFRIKKINC